MAGLDLNQRGRVERAVPAMSSAVDLSDVVVSSTVAPAMFTQDHASAVALKNGGWLVAWDDERAGSRKIFWQQFDQLGNPVGGNALMAGSTTGNNFVEPKLATDTAGRVYLAYRDQTAGLVMASRYTAALAIDYGPVLVNDTSLSSFAGPYDMAAFPDGAMVVVWENYSALGATIARKVYSVSGAVTAAAATVNTDGGLNNHWVPAVAIAPGSGFLVTWEDYRNGQADIYARRYLGNGTAVGGDFGVVAGPDDAAEQYEPRVSYSAKDRYVIGWVDLRSGQEIYLQRYNETTGLVGSNTLVSSGQVSVTNQDAFLGANSSGRTLVMWSASGADNTIQALELDSGLVPAHLPAVVNVNTTGQRWAPVGAYDVSGYRLAAWTEFMTQDADIALTMFNAQGTRLIAEDVIVNDDAVGAHSTQPCLVPSTDWWNLVCWTDRRGDAGDVYLRALSNGGMFVSSEHRVNQDAGSSLQSEPCLAVSSDRGLVVWNDGRTLNGVSGQRVFGRFCSFLAELSTTEFLITDSTSVAVKNSPHAAMNASGRALVVWLDRRSATNQVYGRWLTTDGALDGAEFMISSAASDSAAVDLQVGLDDNGEFNVVWLDAGLAAPSVKLKRYASDKSLSGSFTYTPSVAGLTMDQVAVDFDPGGTITLFWVGIDGARRAYLTRLTSAGSESVTPFEITDDAQADPSDPSVSVCENGYVSTVWIDRRTGIRTAYYQLLTPALGFVDANQAVSTTAPEFMQDPVTDARHGRAWFLWSDPRENGLSVYAASRVYLPTDVDDPDPTVLPGSFALAQNYPNPFNPSTEISFALPKAADITLTVYNIVGQKVAVLADGVFTAGDHTVTWNGTDAHGEQVSSGVYFYRLASDERSLTRKMMLVK